MVMIRVHASKTLVELITPTFGRYAPAREARVVLRPSDHKDDAGVWHGLLKRIPKECHQGDPERSEWDCISTFGDPLRERVVRLRVMADRVECTLDHYADEREDTGKVAQSG